MCLRKQLSENRLAPRLSHPQLSLLAAFNAASDEGWECESGWGPECLIVCCTSLLVKIANCQLLTHSDIMGTCTLDILALDILDLDILGLIREGLAEASAKSNVLDLVGRWANDCRDGQNECREFSLHAERV